MKKIIIGAFVCLSICAMNHKRKIGDFESPPVSSPSPTLTTKPLQPDGCICKVINFMTRNTCKYSFHTQKDLKDHLMRMHSFDSKKLKIYFQIHT